jgi:peptidoglycan/LPS O-acetylase OafA/YrhL
MKWIPELNGLRGAAFLFIFFFHTLRLESNNFFLKVANAIFRSGWLGVDLFFVLSGFLITRILLDNREEFHKYRIFYTRRLLRIFPIYYLVLIFVFIVSPLFTEIFVPLEKLKFYFLTYTYNFWVVFTDSWAKVGALDHFWYLCIEEQFYLFWPFIVFTLINKKLRKFCIFIFIVSVLIKISIAAQVKDWFIIYVFPLCRLEGFASGAFIAILHKEGHLKNKRHALVLLLFMSTLLLILGISLKGFYLRDRAIVSAMPPLMSLFYASLLYLLMVEGDSLLKKLMRSRFLTFFGLYSYGLYVYHYIIWYVLTTRFLFAKQDPLTSFTVMAISLPVSILSYHIYEQLFLRLKYKKSLWPHFHY